MSVTKGKQEQGLGVRDEMEVQEPPLYQVLLHNDDYTSMDFVILVLEHVFRKSMPEATRIMLNVHQQGIGVAGIYPREICETKIAIVRELARKNAFPLRCTMERIE
jgi:ATP-dependent Clp protease adaptor protein ClpS